MSQKFFCLISGSIFALVALTHLIRIVQGWNVVIATHFLPISVSWISLVVASLLAGYGLYFGLRK